MQYPIWYKQSGFRFEHQERVIYIDPWDIPDNEPKADIILITHSHYDHFDIPTIHRLRTPKTIILGPPDVVEKIPGDSLVAVGPNEQRIIDELRIQTVPAYNLRAEYHPKKNDWLGYLFTANDMRYYHAGDTDAIPEMTTIEADVAFLPIGGTYTMNVNDAVKAAKMLRVKTIVPMHYGFIVGSSQDGGRLQELLPDIVEILTPRLPFER